MKELSGKGSSFLLPIMAFRSSGGSGKVHEA
jgi:hypothetical protein